MSSPPVDDLAEGFARHVSRWATEAGAPSNSLAVLQQAARLASQATQNGHVCSDLTTLAGALPERDDWADALIASRMVARSETGLPLPLVLDPDGRIYLHRYFDLERRLAAGLMSRLSIPEQAADPGLKPRLAALFAHNAPRLGQRPDWQKLAAALAWRNRLTIISGGPGTGKTTTVVALLACLLEQNADLRIALAAPTGKAAARMLEALRRQAGRLPEALRRRLPTESFTLHRLLGVTSEPGRFRHHAGNPLPVDVLVVDEASMLDLALATRLIEAVPADARLILLGDKDQLAAVEAGAVFAELSADPSLSPACIEQLAALTDSLPAAIQPPQAMGTTPLMDCVIWFAESYRFASDSGIGRLAADINAGRGMEACTWMTELSQGQAVPGPWPAVTWLTEQMDGGALPPKVKAAILAGYQDYLTALRQSTDDPQAIFSAFDRFRVLCAVHDTPRGTQAINQLVADFLRKELGHAGPGSEWYVGRPIMVRQNDYVLKLFNGDVGICLAAPDGQPMVYFPQQGESEKTSFRSVAPLRLPPHDSAYAVTVHKSQGSEFDSVLLLLPDQASRVLCRELVYTGVTRAVHRVVLASSKEIFLSAVAQATRRHSGLIARLTEIKRQETRHGPQAARGSSTSPISESA